MKKNARTSLSSRASVPATRDRTVVRRGVGIAGALAAGAVALWVVFMPHQKGPAKPFEIVTLPTPALGPIAPGANAAPVASSGPIRLVVPAPAHAPPVSERQIPAAVARPPVVDPRMHLPAPPVAPPNPQTTKPPMDNPGGVNGARPARAEPGGV
jgi:hypothetical protein